MCIRDSTKVDVDTAALYVYDTIEINPQWQVTGGLLLEQYQASISNKRLDGAAAPGDDFDDTELTLCGKLGVVYKPLPNGSVYAAYGVSTQPPGSYLSNSDISRSDQGLPALIKGADPVRAHNYEIGTKWDFFDRRLSTTAALLLSLIHI